MCSATDSFDIALASINVDICHEVFDGDPADPQAQASLDFSRTVAFENFSLEQNPLVYDFPILIQRLKMCARSARPKLNTLRSLSFFC